VRDRGSPAARYAAASATSCTTCPSGTIHVPVGVVGEAQAGQTNSIQERIMSDTVEVKVPAIGDFEGVEIIEVLVRAGDTVQAEDPLISLESDKATMEVPSPRAGTASEVKVAEGDKVSE